MYYGYSEFIRKLRGTYAAVPISKTTCPECNCMYYQRIDMDECPVCGQVSYELLDEPCAELNFC